MVTPEKLEKDADKTEEKKVKPLPALVSPTVNLAIEIRKAIAIRCRDTGDSFSLVSNRLWIDLLKKEGKIKADLNPDLSAKRVGGAATKAKLAEKDETIATLQKELAALKASRKP